jgi:hypothetical protein
MEKHFYFKRKGGVKLFNKNELKIIIQIDSFKNIFFSKLINNAGSDSHFRHIDCFYLAIMLKCAYKFFTNAEIK